MSFWRRIVNILRPPGEFSPAAPKPLGIPGLPPGEFSPGAPDWAKLLAAVGFFAPEAWAKYLAEPAARSGIHARRRAAAFAATIAHESAGGTRLVESLNYTPAALMRTWPHRFPPGDAERMGRASDQPADQRAIAERAYGGRMGNAAEGHGDGWRFRGRGLIQITGRANYRAAGKALGLGLEDDPDLASRPEVAAQVAAWFWAVEKRCNALADAGDVAAWRRAINGGDFGLDDVRRRYEAALAV